LWKEQIALSLEDRLVFSFKKITLKG